MRGLPVNGTFARSNGRERSTETHRCRAIGQPARSRGGSGFLNESPAQRSGGVPISSGCGGRLTGHDDQPRPVQIERDRGLLAAARLGDERAFGRLIEQHKTRAGAPTAS